MSSPLLATKLYIPPLRPNAVIRPRLREQLNRGLHAKLTLVSAPAGFGKTTMVCEWVRSCGQPVAWLALDEGDSDPVRFLTYLVAALQKIRSELGATISAALQSPQPPPFEVLLTTLLNELAALADGFVLVLDDYHVIDSKPVDQAVGFLLEHLPPQHHLVITTREDPNLPLARLRVRGQLAEVRASELRFTPAEAADFLQQTMGLHLPPGAIAALENRTEGWIAGLQLAALSLQGHQSAQPGETGDFIQSFSGSHRFVMDYLIEEVLNQQPQLIQTFLLRTSILERMCGELCDAVVGRLEVRDWRPEMGDREPDPNLLSLILSGQGSNFAPTAINGQTILESLDQANLFLIPLDNERRWYRYHHLFAELLRQRLQQQLAASSNLSVNDLHIRASQWFEENDLAIEAFRHATAANDVERAERLIEGEGIPFHLRGAVLAILKWLDSLPPAIMNARPWLWWRHASLLLISGQTTGVEQKLQAAEDAAQRMEMNDGTRNLLGRVATARAVLALTRYQVQGMLMQSRRALEYLAPNNLSARASSNWTLGFAYYLAGDRRAAFQAYSEAVALSQRVGDTFIEILATIGVGNIHEVENRLLESAQTFRRVLHLAGDQPLQIVNEAHLCLARIYYEWNDLESAERHGQQSLHLAKQYESVIDRFILCEMMLARLRMAQGDLVAASTILAETEQSARQPNFAHRLPEVAAQQVLLLLRQGNVREAANLAQSYNLPISQARVHLAEGDAKAALNLLVPLRRQMEEKSWSDQILQLRVLESKAHHAQGNQEEALQSLVAALKMAEPGGHIRLFLDEGEAMARLLRQLLPIATAQGISTNYLHKLLAALGDDNRRLTIDGGRWTMDDPNSVHRPSSIVHHPLPEPLSEREVEVLQLIAAGYKNQEIADKLIVSLNTVRYHTKNIFGKLGVNQRTQAVTKAQQLGLLGKE